MKESIATSTTPQPALIFIPDISGFTQFVTNVESSHAQHIIEELLEIIMDANDIGMEVSEVEGDAVLFYRFGKAPTAAELLAQVQKMFVRFHAHLMKYSTHRICNCGACKTATDLTLKFVAHYGDITLNAVKQYQKLFGKDVIVAHRLMKNQIDDHEYALVTHRLVQACPQWVDIDTVAWAPLKEGEEDYDSGQVNYCFLTLAPLMEHLPAPAPDDYSLPGARKFILHTEDTVDAPMELVFDVIADVAWRNKWIPDTLPEVVDINTHLTQAGQMHRCLTNGPAMIGHDYSIAERMITFTETDPKKTRCVVFTLEKLDDTHTRVSSDLFIRPNLLVECLLKFILKKKIVGIYTEAWKNLNTYCKGLIASGQKHPYELVLKQSEAAA
jgi:hypothetical protein